MMNGSISKKVSVLFLVLLVAFVVMAPVSYGAPKAHKEMKLTMATYVPVGYPVIYEEQKFFVDRVNEKGKGIVQINMYWGGTLLGGAELLPGLQAGTADIVFQTSAYLLGSFPILGIQILPIWTSSEDANKHLKMGTPLAQLQNDILKKKDIFQLAAGGTVPEFLWTRKKLVRSPQDMKGLKIRVAGKVEALIIKTLGAVPVTLPSAELPQALQRGVVDGALMNPWSAPGRGVEEFCKYMLVYSLSEQATPIYVKASTWAAWPDNVKEILSDAAAAWEKNWLYLITEKYDLKRDIIPFYEKAGMKSVFPSEDEANAFRKTLKPVVDWWVEQVGEDVGRKALKYTDFKY